MHGSMPVQQTSFKRLRLMRKSTARKPITHSMVTITAYYTEAEIRSDVQLLGTSVGVWGTQPAGNVARMTFSIDGMPYTPYIANTSTPESYNNNFFSSPTLPAGEHTLTITAFPTSRQYITYVDYITYTTTADVKVDSDAWVYFADTHSSIRYDGGATPGSSSGFTNTHLTSTYHSLPNGSSVTFEFNGI